MAFFLIDSRYILPFVMASYPREMYTVAILSLVIVQQQKKLSLVIVQQQK